MSNVYKEQRKIARVITRANLIEATSRLQTRDCFQSLSLDTVDMSNVPGSWFHWHYVYIQRRTKQRNLSRKCILTYLPCKIHPGKYSWPVYQQVSKQEQIDIITEIYHD